MLSLAFGAASVLGVGCSGASVAPSADDAGDDSGPGSHATSTRQMRTSQQPPTGGFYCNGVQSLVGSVTVVGSCVALVATNGACERNGWCVSGICQCGPTGCGIEAAPTGTCN